MDIDTMRQQLTERLTENYGSYQTALLLQDRQTLIDRAGEIADTANVYHFLMERSFTEQELSYLLQFQNPLEVVSDGLRAYEQDFSVLDGVLGEMVDRQAELSMYPLAKDAPVPGPETQRRFMNVDIESSLRQLMGQITVHYRTDLQYALDAMRECAESDSPEKKNFVVFFRNSGVECMSERDIFIGDSRSFNTCQYFHTMTSEPVLSYAVEVTGNDRGKLRGNLFQVDNHQLAVFAGRAASPYTGMTVSFMEGHQALIPRDEYSKHNRYSIEAQYGGHMKDTRFEPEDESVVRSAVRQEHDRREKLPKGHFAAHVKKLEEGRIQAEAERIAAEFKGLLEPNSPDGNSFTVPISPDFVALSDERQTFALFLKLQELMPDLPIYIDPTQREEGKFSIGCRADKVEERAADQPRRQSRGQAGKHSEDRPSVLAQLAEKSQQDAERPAGHRPVRDSEAR